MTGWIYFTYLNYLDYFPDYFCCCSVPSSRVFISPLSFQNLHDNGSYNTITSSPTPVVPLAVGLIVALAITNLLVFSL
jgi:hypothetical protein